MFKNRTQPIKHPPLQNGWTRIELPQIEAETDKAILFVIDGIRLWFPRSVFIIRWGATKLLNDDRDCLDIKNWFYDKQFKK